MILLLVACSGTEPAGPAKAADSADTGRPAPDTADSAEDTGGTAETDVDSAGDTDTATDSGPDTGPAAPHTGLLELDLDDADPRIVGDATLQAAGTSISVGDADGDGEPDILVSGGYTDLDAWFFPANVTGVHEVAEVEESFSGGEAFGCSSGYCVSTFVRDVDGDGNEDALFGMPHEGTGGAAYLMLGPFSGERDVSAADASLTAGGYVETGYAIGSGDFDADGLADLVVGSPGDITGYAYVIYGPASGDRDIAEADASLHGVTTDGEAGTIVGSAGDIDGDGNDDILVGTGYLASTVYVVHGPARGAVDLWDADLTLATPCLDAATAADLDGDGIPELVLGCYRDADSPSFRGVGHAWVFAATGWTTADEGDAVAVMEGEDAYPGAGGSLSPAGDTNADGREDLLVGAVHDTFSGGTAAYLVLGPVAGSLSLADASVRMEAHSDSLEPMGLSPAGDIDGDGLDDVIVSAPRRTEVARQAGTVWPLYGAELW